MTTVTLDFAGSYRAVANTDLDLPVMMRDAFGWDGQGAPQAEVKLIDGSGGITVIAAFDPMAGLPAFWLAHAPGPNHFDLISLNQSTALIFDVAVDGAPIWENYVDAVYTGDLAAFDYSVAAEAYQRAYDDWTTYVTTHEFTASSAVLRDNGGTLGQFSASTALVIEDFTTATEFFAVHIIGSGFNDKVSGGAQDDTLDGADGDDTLLAEAGSDRLSGGAGNDLLDGQDGADTVVGDGGDDRLAGEAGNDRLSGGDGNDGQYGGTGRDQLSGGGGDDRLHGDADDDILAGSAGADLIYGDDGNDTLVGGFDDDTLNGGAGTDSLSGGSGRDALSGGDGDDRLFGGDDKDFLRGGAGKDVLTGDGGGDIFLFNAVGAANADRVTDFVHLTDLIGLEKTAFAGVHAALDAQEFRIGTAAADGDDRILYDAASGRLYYDPDGTLHGASSAAQVLFAIIANHAALSFEDFSVI